LEVLAECWGQRGSRLLPCLTSILSKQDSRSLGSCFPHTTNRVGQGSAKAKFHRLFTVPEDENLGVLLLVRQLTWEIPSQGWLYLTVNHQAFYSFILRILIRWTDVTAPTLLSISSSNSIQVEDISH
jgi:hypothetical protein